MVTNLDVTVGAVDVAGLAVERRRAFPGDAEISTIFMLYLFAIH